MTLDEIPRVKLSPVDVPLESLVNALAHLIVAVLTEAADNGAQERVDPAVYVLRQELPPLPKHQDDLPTDQAIVASAPREVSFIAVSNVAIAATAGETPREALRRLVWLLFYELKALLELDDESVPEWLRDRVWKRAAPFMHRDELCRMTGCDTGRRIELDWWAQFIRGARAIRHSKAIVDELARIVSDPDAP